MFHSYPKIPESIPPIRSYTLQQLANLYRVCERTMRRWLARFKAHIGPRVGFYYNVRQVKTIFEKLTPPHPIDTDILLPD